MYIYKCNIFGYYSLCNVLANIVKKPYCFNCAFINMNNLFVFSSSIFNNVIQRKKLIKRFILKKYHHLVFNINIKCNAKILYAV